MKSASQGRKRHFMGQVAGADKLRRKAGLNSGGLAGIGGRGRRAGSANLR